MSSALQLTYLATQGILQAKHDPVQAQILYDSVSGPIRSVWRGHALERKDVDGKPVWTTVKEMDADGNMKPIQATKDEWVNSFMALHTDPTGLDLGGVINPDHVKQVAEALYNPDTGRMYDIEDEQTIERLASAMDILAYGPNNAFDTLCRMADNEVNIFTGRGTELFMPKNISKNLEILAENEEKLEHGEITADELHDGMRAIVKNDTRDDYDVHAKVDFDKSAIELDTDSVDVAAGKGMDTSFTEQRVETPVEEFVAEEVAEQSEQPDVAVETETPATEGVAESVEPEQTETVVSESEVETPATETVETVTETTEPASAEVLAKEPEQTAESEKPTGFDFNKSVEKEPEPEKASEKTAGSRRVPDVSNIVKNSDGLGAGEGDLGDQ